MVEGKKESIWDKMGSIDYRIIYAVFIVMLSIPIFSPLGIPMKVSQPVQDYYNAIVNLPPDSAILVHSFVDLSVWADTGPILIATWKTIWDIAEEKNIKIIAYTSLSDGALKMSDLLLDEIKPPQWRADSYGETWVDLGYIPVVNEPVQASFAADITSVAATDGHIYDVGSEWVGTPLLDIPVVKDIAARGGDPNVINVYDFDLYIWGSWGCTSPDQWVRQFWTTGNPLYELPMVMMTIGNCVPNVMPYYGADKPILGFVPGSAGAAGLELLCGHKGEGIVMADIGDLAGIATVFFLILGNVSYWGKRLFEKEER